MLLTEVFLSNFRCETRPGPEFVLRKYLFRRSSFNAQLYYYTDDACTIATHSITAKGSFRPMRNSWRTPGAYEANYRLSQVIVIPYTSDKANYFRKVVHRHCKPIKGVSIKPFRKFKIFQFTKYSKENKYVDESDFDCSNIFNFTMNELQLVRVERRHLSKFDRTNDVIQSQARSRVETELLLGDVSTNMKYRQQYRPTYYQVPLKKSKVGITSRKHAYIIVTPLKPHFYIIKLGFTGVYIIFLISAEKHGLWVLVRTASSRWF